MTTTGARFDVRPIGTVGAAEIIGLDCSRELSSDTRDAIWQTFLAHPVLVFRDQKLSPPQQRRFTEQLGPIEEVFQQRFVHPDDPQVLVVTNELRPDGSPIGVVDAGDYQHTDGQIFEIPTTATLLYSVRNPQTGGDTEFANMYLAYDAVPDDLKRAIAGRTGTYHVSKTLNKRVQVSAARPGGKEFYESQEAYSAVHHPLVRTHPETKRKALYVSPRFTLRIDDMDEAESDRILDQLFAIIAEERFKYRHHWGTNDLVMWDNRCMTHRATGGYALPDIRRMHRTTIKGTDRPAYIT
jgi:taurine dioxygenase